MTLDEVRRINDRRLARYGQKYYTEDKVYIGNSDGSLSLIVKDIQNQYNPTAGTGISITGNYPNQTISNTAPDQTVSINTTGTGLAVTGGYPSFTLQNTLPDQTVSLTAGTGISVSGTYPSFTITNTSTGGGGGILHGTALGTDTYTATITGVTSYNDGDAYLIRFTNGNTVAGPTLNINGLGAITLYRNNDGQLIGGDIWAGGEMLCIYNSTTGGFQCIGTSPNSIFAYITNDDTVTITRGQPVYAFSGTGDRMTVKLAYNTSDATSARTIGVVYSTSIAPNQKGFIIVEGLLDGLSNLKPVNGWVDGDQIYLGSTAGSITRVKPYAPNHMVYIGIVTTTSPGSAGRMHVKVQNGYELDEIHNVDLITTPPVNNDVLTYITGSPDLWKPRSIGTILGYTPVPSTRTLTINGSGQDLSADRTWSVGTVTSVAALTLGTTGTDLSSTVANGTTTPAITLNVPTASATNRGALSSTDWTTFNNKQNAITLTTTGTSGAATLIGATLNIPQYAGIPVAILEEGVTLTSGVTSINFVGTGVTATAVGTAVTVTANNTVPPAAKLFNYYNFI